LLLGVSIALLKNFRPQIWQKILPYGNIYFAVGLILTTIGFYCFRYVYFILNFYPTVFAYPVLCIGLALLVLSALCPTSILSNIQVPGAKTIAILSYAMYLIQKPVIHATNLILLGQGYPSTSPVSIAASFGFTILASAMIYIIIERPFLKLRDGEF
jgi:peptidoglycan/LPS O-acetylase OafA/YrhL